MPNQPIPPVPITCGKGLTVSFQKTEQLKTVAPGPSAGFPPPGWGSIPEETRKEIMRDWARDRLSLTNEGTALVDAVKEEARVAADNGTICLPCPKGEPCPKDIVVGWGLPDWATIDVLSVQQVSTPDGVRLEKLGRASCRERVSSPV